MPDLTPILPTTTPVDRGATVPTASWQTWLHPAWRLGLLVFAVMGASIGYEFVNWDDPWYVIHNPYNKSWGYENLKAIACDVVNRNYAPLTLFVLLLEHTFFGLEPAGYHAFNLVLHAVNAVLVYVLLNQLTQKPGVAFWTAAVFAIHPVQLESVVWVSSLKGLLCTAFILGHCICWLRPKRTPKQEAWGLLFFGLALLSKALTIVVPVIVWLYEVMVAKQPRSQATARQFIPGLLSVWLLLTTVQAQESVLGGIRSHFELSKAQILAVDSVILWRYVGMLVWPSDLCVLYDPPTRDIAASVIFAYASWIAVGTLLWRIRRRWPLVVFGLSSALILLVPVLNLTRITTLMNDRYLYLPLVPFFAILFGSLDWLKSKLHAALKACDLTAPLNLQLLRQLPLIMVVLFSTATIRHMPVWHTDQSLWEHTASRLPNVPVVRIQYAWMLKERGQSREALAVLQTTIERCQPDELDRRRILETIAEWQQEFPNPDPVQVSTSQEPLLQEPLQVEFKEAAKEIDVQAAGS